MTNIIDIYFDSVGSTATAPSKLWQWSKGQVVRINGLDLPTVYQVHFSNNPTLGTAEPVAVSGNMVSIPDIYLTTGEPVYLFVWLSDETSAETIRKGTIYVAKRSQPSGEYDPTAEQQTIIDGLIGSINTAVDTAEGYANSAQTYSGNAATSATEALNAKDAAQGYAEQASQTAQGVEILVNRAEDAADDAETAKQDVEQLKQAVEGFADDAESAKTDAETARGEAQGFAQTASAKASEALQSASQASQSATTATEQAQTATAKASEASQSAETATAKASEASASATTATTKASEASASASTATTAKNDAVTAKNAAVTAKTCAETARTGAEAAAQSVSASAAQIATNTSDIADLKADLNEITDDNVVTDYIDLTAVSTHSGNRVVYNSQYQRIFQDSSASDKGYKVYQVTAGTYRIYGHGYDTTAGVMAVVGNADIATSGATYCGLLQVVNTGYTDTGSYTWHTVIVDIVHDGYLYVNSLGSSHTPKVEEVVQNNVKTVKTDTTLSDENLPANAKATGDAIGHKGIIKNGQNYTYIQRCGNQYIAKEFRATGVNSLIDWRALYYGDFNGSVFTPEITVYEAYTDIIGPYSIGRTQSEGGKWAGGVHSKTVDGVNLPTARQESIKVLVDGDDISNSADGFYPGNAIIETINSVYFPQTITDGAFTDAVKAIEETRRFILTDTFKVEVLSKTLTSVYISMYCGMQMQSAWGNKFIIPSNDAELLKADISVDVNVLTKGHKMEIISDDVLMQMILDDDGIGTYKYNDGASQYAHIMARGNKIYFTQIYNTTIASGKCLYWSGAYNVFRY